MEHFPSPPALDNSSSLSVIVFDVAQESSRVADTEDFGRTNGANTGSAYGRCMSRQAAVP
jgi:hypothetical protein